MRPGLVALAGLLVSVCAGGAGGSPLLPSFVGAALQSKVDIEAVGWRYRHTRGYFWGGRRSRDVERDVADSLASRSNGDIESTQWRRQAAATVGTIGLRPVLFEMKPTLRVPLSPAPPHQAPYGPTVAVVADGWILLRLAKGCTG
jgi:hypothetical protein